MERKECTCLAHEYFTISGRNLPRALVYLLLQQVLTLEAIPASTVIH